MKSGSWYPTAPRSVSCHRQILRPKITLLSRVAKFHIYLVNIYARSVLHCFTTPQAMVPADPLYLKLNYTHTSVRPK